MKPNPRPSDRVAPGLQVVDDVPGGLVVALYVIRDGRLEADGHFTTVSEMPRQPRRDRRPA